MKTTSALRAEITVQWQPLLQLQGTTLVCSVIKQPLRMYCVPQRLGCGNDFVYSMVSLSVCCQV